MKVSGLPNKQCLYPFIFLSMLLSPHNDNYGPGYNLFRLSQLASLFYSVFPVRHIQI